ncbi:MAG: FdhF/YdeP family oxidoreductase [Thermoplasmatota archaeon]
MKVEKPRGAERLRIAVPFGLAVKEKPRHYREMIRVAWENKRHPIFATRILRHGVCDGCSLGPRGLHDDVMDGVHLCLTRLKLLHVNTMDAMPDGAWDDVEALRALSNEELQDLGRIPYPLLKRAGDKGFRRISWETAIGIAATAVRETPAARQAYFATSRGITNETYYTFQKLARLAGTNNVDLCSRMCHAPSVTGLRETIGFGAPTISLSDLIGTDLVVLFGSNIANNQPVAMKYLHVAKQKGTRVAVVNPVREPALERYWVPSVPSSALWGTATMDEFYQVAAGGDIAFITGTLKAMKERGALDDAFIAEHTANFEALDASLDATSWESLEAGSGLPRAEMEAFAETYANARSAVLVYSMGLTQHVFGVSNVHAIVNLALAKGNVGRAKAGILPIRGHSGVQGGGEIGVDPEKFPGGVAITPESAAKFGALWGGNVSASVGMMTGAMMEAALAGELDLLYNIGGNLLDTMPDPDDIREAMSNLKLRIHQDIVLNTSTLLDGPEVLLLPAATRYETPGGVTATSTERRIRYSPEIKGRRIGDAKPEWLIPALIGKAALGPKGFAWSTTDEVRTEMARAMPMYAGIEKLSKEGESVQWGGPTLALGANFANMPGGRARFTVVPLPPNAIPDGKFQLSTRRGKQFNSMLFGKKDASMGNAMREDVFLSEADARRLGVANGDAIKLANANGEFRGRARVKNIAPRHVQMYWPEANILIAARFDARAGIPDYNAFVTIEKG